MIKAVFTLILSIFVMNSVQAELFKWKDAEGNIFYSDQPPPGQNKKETIVEEKELPQIVTVPAPEIKSNQSSQSSKSQNDEKYKSITISSPIHDSEVRENSGNVSISVEVLPNIFEERGDIIAIYLDDVEVSRGPQTTVQLKNIDRGTHTVRAEIVNNYGYVVRATRPTVFHLKRFHVN